ncbi:hypothetical protein SAMN06297251_10139 [Fulvimarina manganoxydans]|uniref:Uncharacterized protein n=1 Tax=Fulvimarina manganoxydans TaxID=937218 RepID=A0A1W1Y8N2_9HYPH|nr:hypothetical protein [Fulvimarina manganoxydans]SMC32494.1 hypothetical protein SAMN06297251_10139 [Fulvimarina manganoxydans]
MTHVRDQVCDIVCAGIRTAVPEFRAVHRDFVFGWDEKSFPVCLVMPKQTRIEPAEGGSDYEREIRSTTVEIVFVDRADAQTSAQDLKDRMGDLAAKIESAIDAMDRDEDIPVLMSIIGDSNVDDFAEGVDELLVVEVLTADVAYRTVRGDATALVR